MEHHDVLVVGGGNAGVSLAARLLRGTAGSRRRDVALLAASQVHRYRPLLNYVGTGQARMSDLERPTADVVPRGCTWIPEDVVAVDPLAASVTTTTGRTLGYDTLVLGPGLEEDWEATPGLREAYAAGWAASTFTVDAAPRVWPALRALQRGSVLFTVPPEPAPCGATALKPLLTACDVWRRRGVLEDLDVHLVLPGAAPTGLDGADAHLERLLAGSGVRVHRHARVASVDAARRTVSLGRTTPGAQGLQEGAGEVGDLAFAHVVPHYRAAGWIRAGGLADDSPAGLVDVDQRTLRHHRHRDVWALGDAAALGIRPSGGALREQVDVLADNIDAAAEGRRLRHYEGYTVMPVTTGRHGLVLAEVDRAGRAAPSVPLLDLTRPRGTTWLFDRYGLPVVYFRRILRGKV